jgi:para-nitrobenzyl esterase
MTTINTRLGKVNGLNIDGVLTFLGIRYGQAPIGAYRFMPPIAAAAWHGTADATRYPNRAMQPQVVGTLGQAVPGDLDEDCLFLNLVTPSVDGSHRPVLVWIHGGGFSAGSANEYDGSVLARQGDVVVVTVNYRLGPFGFLDLSALGNEFAGSASNGFRDQILALEWVRENIADYGGDPYNVTIFGESAGGAAVLALLAASSADGLFHKAIAHSPAGPKSQPRDITPGLAEKLGVDRSKLVKTLRGLTATELQNTGIATAATVDGTVITRAPEQAILERGANGVPLIAGSNHDEGTLFTEGDNGPDQDPGHYDRGIRVIANGLLDGRDSTEYIEGLKAAYANDSPKAIYERAFADVFRKPSISAVERSTRAGPGGWLYRFDLPTTLPYKGKLTGATHACEMAFTFNTFANPNTVGFSFHDGNDPDVRRLGELWSNTVIAMARTGDPNGAGLPYWPRYSLEDPQCLILDKDPRVETGLDALHLKLWGDT